MSDNSAVIKVVKKQTREYNDLLRQHNTLLKVHLKAVNDCADCEKENYDLRKLLKETQKEVKIVQESLDGCQREVERLNDEWELVVKRDLG